MGAEDDPKSLIDPSFEDAESDPLWQQAALLVDTPRPAKGYVTVPLPWLARVSSVVLTPTHLIVAQLLYCKCLRQRGQTTVTLSNVELKPFGISRYAKYRTLAWLRGVGMVAAEETDHGRSGRVTLLWFP
jgi:hypothetical protein